MGSWSRQCPPLLCQGCREAAAGPHDQPCLITKIELAEGEHLAVILNNLGGTSKLEELVVARELVQQLESRGYKVVRMYTGHMMTSLEMAGILISLLKVTDHPEWLSCLDAPTSAPAWPCVLSSISGAERQTPARIPVKQEQEEMVVNGVKLGSHGEKIVKSSLEKMTSTLISMEGRLNELDSGCGDGDCGSTMATGAKAIQAAMSRLPHAHLLALMHELASLAENVVGSSGGI